MKYFLFGTYTPQFTQELSYISRDSICQQCPMACSTLSINSADDANQDLISNLPAVATEKILKRLPLRMAARMSVLSTKWKDNWLSHRHLVFDDTFLVENPREVVNGYKASRIISNILFHHNGPLQEFFLQVPYFKEGHCIYLSPWLSYLSRTCVKKIALLNGDNDQGFDNLRSLELYQIESKPGVLGSLISSCSRLTLLRLLQCSLYHVIIDVPSLESLVIQGKFDSLSFKNVVRLNNISLDLEKNPKGNPVLNSFKDLATSCELQYLQFEGRLCQFLAAGGVAKSFPLEFNHLNKLCLTQLDFGRVEEYRFVFGMVQSCPCIKELEISFTSDRDAVHQKLDCDESDGNYKLAHLVKVKITGIAGSQAELKFIMYVLAVSVVLEKLYFKCRYFSAANSELQVLRDLLQLPRASPKAQLVWLKQ